MPRSVLIAIVLTAFCGAALCAEAEGTAAREEIFLPPLIVQTDGGFSMVGGLYFEWFDTILHEEHTLLFPLLWQTRDVRTGSTRTASPFGYRETLLDRTGRLRKHTSNVLWWFWHDAEPGLETSSAFPFWWHRREGEKSHSVFFPLYWRFENLATERLTELFLPLYTRTVRPYDEGVDERRSFLWPLYRDRRRADGMRSASLLGPLAGITANGNTGEYRTWFLCFWEERRDNVTSKGIFPLYKVSERDEGGKQTTFLWAWHDDVKGRLSGGVPPFYTYERDEEFAGLNILGPVIDHAPGDKEHFSILWKLYVRHRDETGEERSILGIIRWRTE